MQFRFDSTQEFQVRAVEAVADLFDGQPKTESGMYYSKGTGFLGSPNRLDLSHDDLLRNLNEIQKLNGVENSAELAFIEQTIETADGDKKAKFPNFSVEMETGTGKTYVYIRTALELNRRYGFRRFIIVVPSVAVKEGVLKTFQITLSHFRELFGNLPYKFYAYDSSNLSQIRQFSTSSNVEFMIMTLDSFNKSMKEEGKGNVIRKPNDKLQGATPIHLVQGVRPILILDEPQNMESEKSIAALAALNPLLAVRYSATHKNPYNQVYKLGPADAYRQGLVKKIEVASVLREDDVNQVFIKLNGISAKRKTVSANLSIHKLMKGGAVKETSINVQRDEKLSDKTGLNSYDAFVVEEISPGSGTILFSNGIELQVGESRGADKEAVFEAQIRYTIEEHFRKQRRYKSRGAKVLSLFFIDRVDNYVRNDGIIRRLFSKAFDELKQRYSEWKDLSVDEVQAGYFAFVRKKDQTIFEDSTTGESQKDEEAYDLIMKDKERLLSFDEKVCFIFSHSALREGWDNPNVFQICTLNQTSSEIKKRQEIGRGVRLAVSQVGDRILDPQVNILTVVANQSYESYVSELQSELRDEYGEGAELPPKPANARNRVTINLKKEWTLKPEFKQLWDKIRSRTRYSVAIESEDLIEDTVNAINDLQIRKPRISVTKVQLDVNDEDAFDAIQLSSAKTFVDLAGRYPLPNLSETMTHLLENTTPPVRLTRKTLVDIYARTSNKQAALDNPFEFASVVVRVLKEKLADSLVNGIKYEKINEHYEMTQLKESFEAWEDYVVPANRSIYDKIEYDSNIERDFVDAINKMEEVRLFIKLPSWFLVDTPVGQYNPDWAIVWEPRDEHGQPTGKPLLYLVTETKPDRNKLRSDEKRKIICGEKHFQDALGVPYRVVSNASELP